MWCRCRFMEKVRVGKWARIVTRTNQLRNFKSKKIKEYAHSKHKKELTGEIINDFLFLPRRAILIVSSVGHKHFHSRKSAIRLKKPNWADQSFIFSQTNPSNRKNPFNTRRRINETSTIVFLNPNFGEFRARCKHANV